MTADASDDVRQAGLANAQDGHLTKPLSWALLRAELRRVRAWSPALTACASE